LGSSSWPNSGPSSGRPRHKAEPSEGASGRPIVLEIKNLGFHYSGGGPVLQGINLRIAERERVGIVGQNGAGKTTLLLHLNGILTGTGGVVVRGMEVTRGNLRSVRRQVGLVFQNPDDQLFLPRVFDDVAFGPLNLGLPREEVRARVERALEAVGMQGSMDRSTVQLSEGEKKRVALATVLAYDPSILIFDEPTANLDPKQRRNLLEWMRRSEKTLIVASHDLDFVADLADRVIVLQGGRVVADGPPEGILGDGALMERCGLERPRGLGRETTRLR